MKKILIAMLLNVTTLMCLAQKVYTVGDIIEKDGIPAVVVYVDETGQHGLMVSPHSYPSDECEKKPFDFEKEKQASIKHGESMMKVFAPTLKSYCKKNNLDFDTHLEKLKDSLQTQVALLDKIAKMPKHNSCNWKKKRSKQELAEWDQWLTDISKLLGLSGKENQKIVEDYCSTHNVDMSEYFPDFAWAASLGDGWFIPGVAELDLAAMQIANHFGVMKLSEFDEFFAKRFQLRRNVRFIFAYSPTQMNTSTPTTVEIEYDEGAERKKKYTDNRYYYYYMGETTGFGGVTNHVVWYYSDWSQAKMCVAMAEF